MTISFNDYINTLNLPENKSALSQFGRGIERETLRVVSEGKLAKTPHDKALGSALTHGEITTDYAETLLEFITPVSQSPKESIEQLQDIQKFTLLNINGELLWPMSMPCFVNDQNDIILAQYGTSNIGRMKNVYRQGLKNRYGSMMQVIAGIHFNFSFPESFWLALKKTENNHDDYQDYVSDKYFALIRNYKRFAWLIPYLFGSSPALCPSFLQGKETALPFKKSDNGYLYLDYATSLRMSDLGYTNSEQSELYICYNSLETYVKQVEKAKGLASQRFAEIGVKVNGEYRQLNSNVIQIENELYAPIRPKRVAKSGEKPSQALKERGVEYIEVRAMDVNPFSDTGISLEQVHFLDIFITYCALADSPECCKDQAHVMDENLDAVVVDGRNPNLMLNDCEQSKSIKTWGNEIFSEMERIAKLLDGANQTDCYQKALAQELAKINDPSLTPSAKLIALITKEKTSLTTFALNKAEQYRTSLMEQPYQHFNEDYFLKAAKASHQKQKMIEESDQLTFDEFLAEYFAD